MAIKAMRTNCLTPAGMATIKNKHAEQNTTNVGKDVEKMGPLGTVGGNMKWYSHDGKPSGGSSKN